MKEVSPYFIRRSQAADETLEVDPIFVDPEDESRIDLTPYLQAIKKRIRLIGALVVASVVVTTIYVFSITPTYRAEATLMIRARAPEIYAPKDGPPEREVVEPEFFRTQCTLLSSRVVALDVIRRLGLDKDPRFSGDTRGVLAKLLDAPHAVMAAAAGLFEDGSRQRHEGSEISEDLVKAYLGALSISPVQETSIVKIRFTSTSPELASEIANAHAQAFIRQGIKFKSQSSVEAERFLQHKLVDLRHHLEKSEVELNNYRRSKGIIPGLMSLDGREAVVVDRLADLSKDLTAAQVQRIGLEAQVDLIRRGRYDSLPAVMQKAEVQSLKGQLDTLLSQYAGLSKQFTNNYPPVAQLKAKIDQMRSRLRQEMMEDAKSIEAEYNTAANKEKKLQAEMDRQRGVAMSLNDAAVKYAILQRDVDTNRQLYNSVLARFKDVGIAAEAQTSNASIVDRAVPPSIPSSPKKTQDVTLALVLALMGSAGFAMVLEYFDDSVKTSEEAENLLRLPTLSAIPDFATAGANGHRLLPRGSATELPKPDSPRNELVDCTGLNSLVGESYRHLRTALMLSRAESPPQATLITSATRGEGKTVTAVNTAIVLAQFEGEVLLIDGDLRKGRCHELLGLGRCEGLTEVLTGREDVSRAIRPTPVQRLHLLGSGVVAPNPTELLGSRKMRETLEVLRKRYQYIIIDSPPIIPVTDATVMSTMVDGVLVVVRAGATSKKLVKVTCMKLRQARARIFGTVLNKMHVQSSDYSQYYVYSSDVIETNDFEMN